MRNADRDKRPVSHSIMTAFAPIEDYWARHGLIDAMGPDPSTAIEPLDASLAAMALGFLPSPPVLIDSATEATGGASGVLGLCHPGVLRVASVAPEGHPASMALRAFADERTGQVVPLEFLPRGDLLARIDGRSSVAILADARGRSGGDLADEVGRWIDAWPGAAALVLGLGRVGECRAIEALVRLCSADSGRRFRLLRDQADVLAASGLGLIDRDGGPSATILPRIAAQFSGNFDILDMLKTINQAAIRASRVDDGVLMSYPFAWIARERFEQAEKDLAASRARVVAVEADLAHARAQAEHHEAAFAGFRAWSDEALKVTREAAEAGREPLLYELWCARQRAEAAEAAGSVASSERDRLRAELDEARERAALWQSHAAHPLIKIRRKLSSGRTGAAWRAVRSRLNRAR